MYELFQISPGGYHYKDRFDTLHKAMRSAWDYAREHDATIISITNTETGENCGDYIDYADKAGWLDLTDIPLH